jgi:glycosyltransferase 2 family protein
MTNGKLAAQSAAAISVNRGLKLVQQSSVPGVGKRRTIIIFAALATLAYVGAGFAVDAARVREAISTLGWLGCGLVLTLSVLNYLVRFERWQMFLIRLGHRLPGLQHLVYYLSGFAFTVSPAKAGEAVRSIYLREHGVGYSTSIAALFVERLQDLLAMALLASLVVVERPAYRPLVAGALLLVLTVVIATSRKSVPAFARVATTAGRALYASAAGARHRGIGQPAALLE